MLYLWCGTKSELEDSCDGMCSEALSKRLESDVKSLRSAFNGG